MAEKTDEKQSDIIVHLNEVRLSFPQLFKAKAFGQGEPTFSAVFLLDPKIKAHKAKIEEIMEHLERLAKDRLKLKNIKGIRVPLREPNLKSYDGWEDMYSFHAGSRMRPTVINRRKELLAEEDDVIYGGCYVNATASLWVQNNDYGRAINSDLRGVQFVRDGERFSARRPVDLDEEFEDLGEDEEIDADALLR